MPDEQSASAVSIWRRVDHPGWEYFRLEESSAGATLRGVVIAIPGDTPMRVDYEVTTDAVWRTRRAVVVLERGATRLRTELSRDDQSRWVRDGVRLPLVDGCVDVDLSVTPSTNTLPIRRLRLGLGESSPVSATWVRFPDLTIERLEQIYTRLSDRRYRYESGAGAFTAEVDVDASGVVLSYPPAWQRVTP